MSKYNENSGGSSGAGVLDVLQIVFIVLKLVGVINWSWWVVLIPLWIILGSFGLMSLLYYIIK